VGKLPQSFFRAAARMSREGSTLFNSGRRGDLSQNERIVDLCLGAPGPSTLRHVAALFQRAAEERSASADKDGGEYIFQYGPATGLKEYRLALAELLTANYGQNVSADNLVLTCGATSGLWLTATVFLRKVKPVVFVENPTYFLAANVLADDLGLDLIGVNMDDDGMRADELEAKVSRISQNEVLIR